MFIWCFISSLPRRAGLCYHYNRAITWAPMPARGGPSPWGSMLLWNGMHLGYTWLSLRWGPRQPLSSTMFSLAHHRPTPCLETPKYIVYFHFRVAFVIVAVIILCFSVDTIFSTHWWELHVLFVQLKMLWWQTQDNGHAGSIHLARLKCSPLCWCRSRWIFWSCSSQGSTTDQTH